MKAQGWAPLVLDTSGNGKLDEWTEPGKPQEPGKDMRIAGSGSYAVMPHPTDGSIWYAQSVFAGAARVPALRPEDQALRVLRRAEGQDRPARRRHRQGRRPVGLGLERHARQLRPQQMQGPAQRPERHRRPLPGGLGAPPVSGPGLRGLREHSAEASYYTWVDQHNTFGLGENVPISTAQPQRRLRRLQGRARW